jgi:hypothetical protein
MKSPLDKLWGATVSGVSVAPDLSAMTLDVLVVDATSKPTKLAHRLELDGIQAMHFDRSAPLPWDYSELTSIIARPVPGAIEVVAELWSKDNTLRCVCSGVRLDGATLAVLHAI